MRLGELEQLPSYIKYSGRFDVLRVELRFWGRAWAAGDSTRYLLLDSCRIESLR
jgi:hypothetical protein